MIESDLRNILGDLGVQVLNRNARGWLVARCPFAELGFHEGNVDRTPGFQAKVEPGGVSAFHCFTCKKHGTIASLAAQLGHEREEDLSAVEMQAFLAETPGKVTPFDEIGSDADDNPLESLEASTYMRMFPDAWGEHASHRYLIQRGVTPEASELLQLRYDTEDQRVLFPVFGPQAYDDRQPDLFGFTGRTILSRHDYPFERYPKVKDYAGLQKRKLILGEHLIRDDARPLLIVEGLFALAHMVSIGARAYCDPIAVMGSKIGKEKRDLIVEWDKKTFLLFDDDMAGDEGLFGPYRKGQHEGGGAIDMLRSEVPTLMCLYPRGVDDPDDLTNDHVREMICGGLNESV